jgi:hypothetical protein
MLGFVKKEKIPGLEIAKSLSGSQIFEETILRLY